MELFSKKTFACDNIRRDMNTVNNDSIKNSRVGLKVGVVIFFACLQFFLFVGISHAASITWIAPSAGTWNTASNWSGGVVPGSSDDVTFSASSTQPVTINQNVAVSSITVTSGYTGTITQGAYSVTLTPSSPSSTAYAQAAGTFTGGTGAMTANGNFSLSGGSFVAPTNLNLNGTSNTFATPGVFTPNTGNVFIEATTTAITGSSTFYNFQIGEQGSGGAFSMTIATGTALTVTNDLQTNLTLGGCASSYELLGGGEIDAQGNIDNVASSGGFQCLGTSTASVYLDGTGTQIVNGGAGSIGVDQWSNTGFSGLLLPNVIINKSAGSVVFTNNIGIEGNFTNQNATPISAGTSTILFVPLPGVTPLITGSSTFYNLEFSAVVTSNAYSFVIATGTTLTVQGTLISNNTYNTMNFNGGGEIDAQGDIYGAGLSTYSSGGTISLVLNGAGTQNLIGDFGYPSDFVINKPSGSITITGTQIFQGYGTWSNLSGTTINPGTSTVIFQGLPPNVASTSNVVITGSSTFYNLQIVGSAPTNSPYGPHGYYNTFTVATGTALTVTNDLQMFYDSYAIRLLGGGEINAQGNIDVVNPWDCGLNSTGTASIYLDGTGTQTLNGGAGSSGYDGWSGYGFCSLLLPNLTINKSTGTVVFANYIGIEGNFTNLSATPINAGTSTVILNPLPGTIPVITGSSTFDNLIFWGVNSENIYFTIPTSTTLTVQNALSIQTTWGSSDFYGGGQIDVQGNIIGGSPGYTNPPSDGGGTVQFVMDGTSTQIFNYNNYVSNYPGWWLPNLTINKTSGVVGVGGSDWPVITGSLTIQQGELQLSAGSSSNTQRFTVTGPLTVDSGGLLSNYPTVSSTLYFGSSLINNGTVFMDGSGNQCGTSIPNYAFLNSTTTGSQIPWSGTGKFVMRYANVQDQGGTAPITVLNGTNSGDTGGNWSFVTGAVPQLVQSTASSGPSGTSQLTLSFPNPWPRQGDLILVAVSARNQSIAPPTDNASNTYYLVASSTFGSSPTQSVSLYYAKNVSTTQSFAVTVNGTSSLGSQLLNAQVLEYTGMTSSSTLDTYNTNTDTSGSATYLTSNNAVGSFLNELYFGVATISTSTPVAAGSGWTSRGGFSNTSGQQGLYTEDIMSSSTLNTPATWTASASTSYAGIIAVFRPPEVNGFQQSGTLDSQTLDTQSAGAQLNSFVWQGTQPAGTYVKFQFAGSNSASGPWNFVGPDGTVNTYFSTAAGTPMSLVSPIAGYTLFSGYRYFRYRVTLYSDVTQQYTPIVSGVTMNWSP
jgi:hypothetical protein